MNRHITLLVISFTALFAVQKFESSKICKTCHPLIYREYSDSMHRKSSIYNDKVHRAVWNMHPLKKKRKYNCATCHSPSDRKLIEALKDGRPALPEKGEIQKYEPIGCTYCHRIERIEHGKKANINIVSEKSRLYYAAKNGRTEKSVVKYHKTSDMMGLGKSSEGSPFHTIDYGNVNFSNGRMCLGCHEFKKNSKGFPVCSMDLERSKNGKRNCITCHMPQVEGPISTLSGEKSHAYHGFSGLHNRPELLADWVKLKVKSDSAGKLMVVLKNEADHTLFAHPLRLAQLRVTVKRGAEEFKLPPVEFFTVLGKDGRPAMPWAAETVLKQNRIEAHESLKIDFDFNLERGDRVKAVLGYYIVNPKAAKKLGIEKGRLTEFHTLKTERFTF
ncbi:hypothetical protein NNO_0347 [Hydrogenimonas sp.]|nr:hypothetical protein NNO_0347 [Hydrogenimonas sp.]